MTIRMNSVWWVIALASAVMAATAIAAVTHEVGGDKGWGVPDEPSFYATWAADKTFNVGDKLGKKLLNPSVMSMAVFITFLLPQEFKWTGLHDVLEVTKEGFENCTMSGTPNSTTPVIISLDTAGSKYFICTVGRHCTLGQKLNVTTGSSNSTTPAAPAPSSAPASLLASALSAAMFAIGSIFFTCI